MVKGKEKFTLWLSPHAKEKVESFYRQDNCGSQSEFIEKAINFYVGYLHTEAASDFLPEVLGEVIDGNFSVMQKKFGRLLFKQTVENNITNHLISRASAVTPKDLDDLRKFSVYQVTETNGEITLKDALKHQKKLL